MIVLPTLLLACGSMGRGIAQTENIGGSSGNYFYGSGGSGTVTTAPYIYGIGNPGPTVTYTLGGSLTESGGANSGGNTGSKGDSPDFGNGGNGGQGASPGSVTVVLSSGVSITVNDANLIDGFDNVVGGIASAQAGNGGDGGNAGAFGDPGNGGAGGSSQNQVVNLSVDSDVSVNVSVDSTDYGAIGLLSQSVGGVGGDGGDGNVTSTDSSDGGSGGYSGLATVTNAGSIVVSSEQSDGPGGSGILVQSVGGQGGATGSGGLITYGGQGGTGGTAGNVSVTNTGTISVSGDSVTGINVQSVGGGGGAVTGGLSVANLGGSEGGAGGDAGTAELVMSAGSVSTAGNNAQGVLVQAIGGGGGSVGNQTSLTTVGSEAGGGGNGGSASLTFTGGSVITGGTDGGTNTGSTGILVQSIGGGGGNAGTSSGVIAIGSSGGDGGNGGSASAILSNGSVFTEQDFAGAVVVQSIGGGGGNGGNANSAGAGASVAVGGNAGGGGVGGAVSVGTDSSASSAIRLTTIGFQAPGLLVQSIGGSGGTGGSATSVAVGSAASYSLAVGGEGGTGGNAGTVTVGSTDLPLQVNVATLGAYSTGVSINSIGGGGGNGGNAVSASVSVESYSVGVGGSGGAAGNGSSVSVTLAGELQTRGFQAPGLQVQSIGGGGGNGGSSMAVSGGAIAAAPAIGGSAGAGGNAGDVTVSFSGPIETRRGYSPGAIISSIGGGGGTGGSSLSVSAGTVSASVAVGGDGGAGGSGGDVNATLAGDITTQGESSPGALIQSVGGGGGAGGSAVSGSMTAGVVSGGVAVSLGGDGGSGNSAGSVSLSFNDSTIKTGRSVEGILIGHSPALLVQSVGGGGGQGGSSVSGSVSLSTDGSYSGSFGLGGSGGNGGTGGAVTVSLTNMVLDTLGDYSAGLIAQSLGGGGGQGGSSTSMQASASGGTSVSVGGVVGGSGGGGANASSVSVINSGGNISTKGDFAPGLYVQSVGGGGGSGGSTTTLGLSASSSTSVSGSVSIGGSGGGGGTGGAVNVTNSARSISTKGDHSPGIVAQSIGGGGGTGGSTTTLNGSAGGSTSVSGGVSLGGDGGSGSSAGDVSLTTSGVVITGDTLRPDLLLPAGAFSYGILAQSVGGGGGAGGSTSTYNLSASTSGDAVTLGADFGGDGGDGGTGGNVSVTVSGSISTVGFQATGLLAQSVGGGGGAGGSTQSLSASASKGDESYTGSLSLGMGGSGGDGQAAGAVVVEGPAADSLLRISTSGVMALGLNSQSIGGGGGQGGSSMAASITESPSQYSFGASAVEGGSGGTGGTGGSVQLGTSSTSPLRVVIDTTGLAADAVLAQSVGGGGGAGGGAISSGDGGSFSTNMSFGAQGGAGGNSGSVNVYLLGDISTRGTHSSGLIAQSVGGGGGAGGSAISGSTTGDADVDFSFGASVSDGGDGGGGGNAGAVSVSFGGSINTRGVGADGLFIQSVGGGGGRGGAAISKASSSSSSSDTGNSSTSTSGSATMSFGGEGGDGGDGGSASLQALSDIKVSTRGTNAAAITVQSIGGGGGRGGKANANSTTDGNADFSFGASAASGGDGGSGGGGGSVSLGSSSNVVKAQASTEGVNAIALLLQSVGGGGGIGGSSQAGASGGNLSASFAMGGDGGNGGTGGAITVFTDGTYLTQGTLSHAVLIQSIGGGGGQGGSATSNADPSMASEDDSTSADSDFSFGASGGSGGDGGGGGSAGSISGSISGLIRTLGDSAIGLFAQSVGGGGGAGGAVTSGASSGSGNLSASASFAMGGDGGNGGRGGSINLDVPNGLRVATGDSALGTGHGSHGILLQSIGGGGGTGGSVVSSSTVGTSSSNTSMSFGLSTGDGGDGGFGANSGSVNLGSSRSPAALTVETSGDNAMAVFLQSVGGGGGAGGSVNSTSAGGNLSASFAMGGDGGVGGTAGAVSLFADGTYLTRGATSHAVLLQSVGGGGGQGGAVTANATPVSSDDSANASFSFGASGALSGSGGRGGNGSRVTAGLSGSIRTLGDSAIGLFAQSVGGGGGAGGSVTNVADSGGGELSASTTMSMGGAGGSGGSASSVQLTTPAKLTVITGDSSAGTGHGSHALMLQSVGGGGGQGGSVVSSTTAGTSTSNSSFSFGATLATSGSGGAGGAGGQVSLGSSGQPADLRLQTSGDNAMAVFLQSVGGGGGAGGSVNSTSAGGNLSASFAMGGDGGVGGTAGAVSLFADGTYLTRGATSHAVLLQSVGGGGGQGGAVTANATPVSSDDSANASFSFGASGALSGSGGRGGNGSRVTAGLSGSIRTLGDSAIGLFAQSVGGGGGAGGSVTNVADSGGGELSASTTMSMGGAGGSGGSASSVQLTTPAKLTVITGDSSAGTGHGSHALMLQSVGGGGGQGGSVVSSTTAGTSTSNSSFSFGATLATSGSGGAGGAGGQVSLGSSGHPADLRLQTSGDNAMAVFLQSVGGGGGAGGSVNSTSAGGNLSASFALGGPGGNGGTASDVAFYGDGTFITTGNLSHAVLLQSVGGGGGQGGSVTSNADGTSEANSEYSFGASAASGGNGAGGGWSGAVKASLSGRIITTGQGSLGVFAQSIAGGGGAGGSVTSNSDGGNANVSVATSFAMGGAGGSGGSAGSVSLFAPETLTVITGDSDRNLGSGAHAILLQSVGGGGGTAGSVLGSNVSASTANSSVSLGASAAVTTDGGNGGTGGDVLVGSANQPAQLNLITSGDNAHALFLQSVGGGGGSAGTVNSGNASGNLSTSFSMGGAGGNGGQSGQISAYVDGTIVTTGDNSHGFLLQSVGGGGGQGGSVTENAASVAGTSSGSIDTIYNFGLALDENDDSSGGNGGIGGRTTGSITGNVITSGDQSIGVLIQSIGGGGGAGGTVINTSDSADATYSSVMSASMGSDGGTGGDGGRINLSPGQSRNLTVLTSGEASPAILLQSIGGGGGQAGTVIAKAKASSTQASLGGGGGNAGAIQVNVGDLQIQTTGNNSNGLTLQSIGGGGGAASHTISNQQTGALNLELAIGSSGGDGGNGNNLSFTNDSGRILTSGAASTALMLQSIGGGGGLINTVAGGTEGSLVQLSGSIGGAGGNGGDAGNINATSASNLVTTGVNAIGLYAQSIGGGGGGTGITIADSEGRTSVVGSLLIGGSSGSGGNGGAITATNSGTILTTNTQSHGIFGQSIGGGGGRLAVGGGGNSLRNTGSLQIGGTGGSGGDGGSVAISNSGSIEVRGQGAYGLAGQSLGGGGGSVSSTSALTFSLGANGGRGGDSSAINITNSAPITTTGRDGIALSALSIGGGGGDAGLTINDVTLGARGGSVGDAGAITITNNGALSTSGVNATGIVARSIGGGGGRVTGSVNQSDIQLGASGDSSGNGGRVTVTNRGTITTSKRNATAVTVSSIGGGGGEAASGYSNATLGSINASGAASAISLTNTGTLITEGMDSAAMLVQSIGGGGGSIDQISGNAQLGSKAAVGAQNGGTLNLTNSAELQTSGSFAPIVMAQSVGGGGGHVSNVGGSASLGSQSSASGSNLDGANLQVNSNGDLLINNGDYSPAMVAQSIGGGGGWIGPVANTLLAGSTNGVGSMSGGNVNASNNATIVTRGAYSGAINLQSIGGGGGTAGSVGTTVQLGSARSGSNQSGGKISLTNRAYLSGIKDFSPLINLQSIGGGGGLAGAVRGTTGTIQLGSTQNRGGVSDGGDINLNQRGDELVSTGNNSAVIRVQSIGGGGGAVASTLTNVNLGASGSGSGSGGTVTVTNQGVLISKGRNAMGLLAQSIGGGGGLVGLSRGSRLTLGGSLQGSGGAVTVTNSGAITTLGSNSAALLAQSIGGGGGAIATATGAITQLGGSEASLANAGEVTVTNRSGLQTAGNGSPTLIAQSIAGGGGFVAETNSIQDASSLRVSLGGNALGQANAGRVQISNSGERLLTTGTISPALVVQSVGGGGGWSLLESTNTAQLGSAGGSSLQGDAVNVTNTAPIITRGDSSAAAVIQSIGGGGGVVGNAVSNLSLGATQVQGQLISGDITTSQTGSITTFGASASALVIQSIGGGGGLGASTTGDAQLGQIGRSSTGNSNSGSVRYQGQGAALQTVGINAPALVVQSIAGGGGWLGTVTGNATLGIKGRGSGTAGSIEVSSTHDSVTTEGRNSAGMLVQSIGGGGGYTGLTLGDDLTLGANQQGNTVGGSVQVTNRSSITTLGLNAIGLMAQSVGGGGGTSATGQGSTITLGASGQGQANAGSVSVTNSGVIQTRGRGSAALIVQSIAGGGGFISQANGSEDYTLTFGATGNVSGKSGSVDVNSSAALLSTRGDSAPVFTAQSIAGGGGYAPVNAADRASTRLGTNGSNGDSSAGDVTVNNRSDLVSLSNNAPALIAQSIGGGGGVMASAGGRLQLGGTDLGDVAQGGSIAVTNSGLIDTRGQTSPALIVQSIGGGGGSAGGSGGSSAQLGATNASARRGVSGGDVQVTSNGTSITTRGLGSAGLVAQSIGGGGGRMGSSSSTATLGGTGLQTGNSGNVSVVNRSVITTLEGASAALVAQSLGGGGGIIALSEGNSLQLGGSDLVLAQAGDVTVNNAANLRSRGRTSPLLTAQSIGGGGGFTTIVNNPLFNQTIVLGSNGLSNGNAGDVNVTNSGGLVSTGASSSAMVVQSIGGGGGIARRLGSEALSFDLQLGSIDTEDARGGNVDVTNNGRGIFTTGDYARPLLVQSIGGGGGWITTNVDASTEALLGATTASGNTSAGNVNVDNNATLSSTGKGAAALVAQSVGGGGGLIGDQAGSVVMGSVRSSGLASGGSVQLTNSAAITTSGLDAPAALAQSIGGGGGRSNNLSGDLRMGIVNSSGSLTASGNAVTLTNRGSTVVTSGQNSGGLIAQSIGGGGGYAGSQTSDDGASSTDASSRLGGGTGLISLQNTYTLNGGSVSLSNRAEITTTGLQSPGVLAQSVGGGGGVAGRLGNQSIRFGMNGSATANAGAVTITNSGAISTALRGSSAVVAQSVAGGGGFASGSDSIEVNLGAKGAVRSQAGAVTVSNSNDLTTLGTGAVGLLAQSVGGGGGFLSDVSRSNRFGTGDTLNLGAIKSNNSSAGAISIENSAERIVTRGDGASALLVQSVGGGGGWAAFDQNQIKEGQFGQQEGINASGGDLTVTTSGGILTLGADAQGLRLQSIGGGGGASSASIQKLQLGSTNASGALFGGDINFTNSGTIITRGDSAAAMALLSLGGGGGTLFGTVDTRADFGATGSTGAGSSLSGGDITAFNRGEGAFTEGQNAPAFVVQSIGGGGGMVNTLQGTVHLGSRNSEGRQLGGDVATTNEANLNTSGDNSAGLIVQSIGGGGGFSALETRNALQDSLVLGSSLSSQSSSGGRLSLSNQGRIITAGAASPGLVAQSIGGGGGSIQGLGIARTGSLLLGSRSATNANAGVVELSPLRGRIATSGSRSAGAVVQSIGGGGGWALVDSLSTTTLGATQLSSGSGGAVSVVLDGLLLTTGTISPGIVVQSVGGGGGFAGDSKGDATLGSSNSSGDLSVNGSSGLLYPVACPIGSCPVQPVEQAVLVDIEGAVTTTGDTSPVMLVQAIGGGGGRLSQVEGNADLGMDGSTGSADGGSIRVISNSGANLTSLGDHSAALMVQSIGGGGGSVNNVNGTLRLGSRGLGSSAGGSVTLNGPFKAITQGEESPGVVLQAIGGGGGYASDVAGERIRLGTLSSGNTAAGAVRAISANWQISTEGRNSPGLVLQSIGGGGGVAYTSSASVAMGGEVIGVTRAGAVSLISKGTSRIQTTGSSSPAVISQSIGGGGGYVGGDGSGRAPVVALGGGGTQLGGSGSVELNISRGTRLITSGKESQGVLAQSIGGGGGYTSQNGLVMRLGMTGGRANAGDVTVDNQGSIITLGASSEGVIAQSIGAGGGSAGNSQVSLVLGANNASGDAGDVVVNNRNGRVSTAGTYSIGVVAQSVGGGGGRVGLANGSMTLGANGGGGNAGDVTLNNAGGLIATSGAYAPAYLMQSVGGGGGQVGLGDSDGSGIVVLGGGVDGTYGSGGTLTLINAGGSLQAEGPFSPGVIHQSIGGGGGWIGNVSNGSVQLGGLNTDESTGADLTLILPFEVLTVGDNSPGVVLQSIGGGGGVVADVSGNATLGGTINRGVDTRGGSLTYTQLQRSVTTLGNDSPGVVLQSIGGGGGLLAAVDGSVAVGSDSKPGSDVSAGLISASNGAPITTNGISSPGFTIQSFGGSGGLVGSAPTSVIAGGSGQGDSRAGAIELTNRGAIITTGANSSGVVLQSIGGGGVYTTTAGGAAIRLGGSVVGLNDSGSIAFTSRGAIRTVGANGAAIVAQSIGGGGGAVFGLEDAEVPSVRLGSDTATSNGAGTVTLTIEDNLSSFGAGSPAVLAQSIGGGGGYAPIASREAQAGATSSSGLDGKAVSILIRANATTTGFSSDGLIAQSIGGGGGMVGSTTDRLQLGAGNGGNGDAAAVTIRSTETITTTGDQSIGISAQSIGAGGGRAGRADGSMDLGANGARGDAEAVTLNLTSLEPRDDGSIVTTGRQSPAFVLQSIGGGGGLVFPNANSSNGDLLLGGGDLGSQGQGAAISFTAGRRSRVITSGDGSSGLAYQSIGGGGGYAGNTSANAQLGGRYRGASSGAKLELVSQVATATQGRNASAMLVQSIGGGGGRVGDVGGNANLGGNSETILPNTADGSGGAITLTLDTALTSSGDAATTVLAQTIGGGGGLAGAIGANANLGGLGRGNRSAGSLALSIDNRVGSAGSNSPALLAQSIGGGGGSLDTVAGNLSLGRNTTLTSPNSGNTSAAALSLSLNSGAQLFSSGNTSPAFIAQSIGGGGGFAASTTGSVQLGAGGTGTLNADASAGAISFSNTGAAISTSGNLSPAVVLQTIGGGGGYTTGGTSTSFSATGHAGTSTASADISASNSGIISTSGDNSFGLLLQTIGGGGGVSGSSSGSVSLNNTNTASNSGSISFSNTGTIATSGTGSHAVVAQTIAGGGGFVFGGVSKDDSTSLLGNPTGSSGDINIDNSGVITASGTNAVALLFQNATGGAFLYQNPDGSVSAITEGVIDGTSPAGEVVVRNSGVIQATGQGGVGITKSTNLLSSGNLRVENAAGAVIQGGDGGSAINLPTSRVERVNNYGTIIGGSDGTSPAITGPGGPDEINNYGEISGDIIIPGITRNIYNAPDARMESQLVDANGNVTLTQSGVINPNGEYRIGNLVVNANYDTTDTSLYEADLVLRSGETDNLTTNFRANLNGTVELLANQVGQAMPGTFISEGIVDAKQGITIGDLKLVAPKSAVASFSFDLIDNNQDLSFLYTVDYAPSGLDPNSTAVGQAINDIQAAGSTNKFESTAALIFAQETTNDLNSLYRQLSGATSAAFPQATITAGLGFQQDVNNALDSAILNQLQRCIAEVQQLQPDQDYTGDPADCGKWRSWVNAGGSGATTPASGSSDQAGYNTTAFNTTIGADTLIGSNTLVGIAGRFDNLWTTTGEPNTFGETEGWSGMLYAKQRLGSATWLTGTFGAGGFNTDITRQVNIPGYPATENATSNSTALGGTLQISQVINTGNRGSLIPSLGLSWLQLNQNSYSESTSSNNRAYQQPGNPLIAYPDPGKASYSLRYDNVSYSSVPLELALEFKQPFQTNGMTVIPRVSVGYAWDLGNTNRDLTAQFTAAPGSSFTVAGVTAPSSWWNIGLGLDVVMNDKLSLYVNGLGQLSPGSTESINYGGGFRWKF
ncbi:autotransporter outer membrane beta-barrel domain-containing protein [Synechococcus sp. MEDNS5]|uniref:autotransporter outer membrane beta-barrel domain-containing protein n=1 Tax=Synechococcus sp. MEDNS5 TaxID=1442554 RepID=UPI0016442BA9|nr:autotransporter outer membrane beta-barrel domain-containing protein [Synechococcus sp. MEDNS5]